MQLALETFHKRHPTVSLLLNVTRHPYSFNGDRRSPNTDIPEGQEKTWHEGLLGYCGGDTRVRDQAEESMRMLAKRAGISNIDYGVQTNWQPINSQRMLLWASRFGKAELFMSALSRRHFQERKSASHRNTLLEAAEEATLDVDAARAFLDTDELVADVWRSYGSTIHDKGIHAIPFFVFNSPLTDGGPFRSGSGRPVVVNGSGDEATFLDIFERFLVDCERAAAL